MQDDIAPDTADEVVNELFQAGLLLHRVARLTSGLEAADHVRRAVDGVDAAIRSTRAAAWPAQRLAKIERDALHVLVVDDNEDMRLLMSEMLSDMSHVDACPDPESALDHLRREPVDVMILDIHFPGGSGLDLLEQLNRFDLRVPTVIVSGTIVDTAAQTLGRAQGVTAVLIKPVNHGVLRSSILEAALAS